MNAILIFTALNDELKRRDIIRELIICGGAALIALKIVNRATKDVDVLKPEIDPELSEAATVIAEKFKLSKNWLNNGPQMLVDELPVNWENHCLTVFSGKNLIVKSISRRDLIYSKLYAAADRMDDIDDLIALNPNEEELKYARKLVLKQDASELWPKIVDECLDQLKERMKSGR